MQGQDRGGELQRFIAGAQDINGVEFHAEFRRELAGAGVFGEAGFLRERDQRWQEWVRRSLTRLHAADEGPITRIGLAVVQQLTKGRVRFMAGQVIVIAGMMVARAAAEVAERIHNRQVMAVLGRQRQMFAKAHARGRSGDWLELAAILNRGVGLHVPGVEVRCPAAQPDENRRAGPAG